MTHRVVSRAEWGAKPPKSKQLLAIVSIRGMAIHYTAAESDRVDDPNDCPARVRGIQRYHMQTNGWADIAYSFLACHHGTVYEGRGWDVRSAANGTNPANDYWLAVCFLGADKAGRDDVTEPGRRSIRWLCDETERRYPKAVDHRPHSDFRPTSCPGDEIRHWLARGMPVEPLPVKEVKPMFVPALRLGPIVAELRAPAGGVWLLAESGAVYAFGGAQHRGAANGQSYFAGRKAALLEANGDGYTIVATTGERYDY